MATAGDEPSAPDAVNPYAAPEAPIGEGPVEASGDLAADEAVRRAYLKHEANVRSIGSLHYLAAVLIGLGLIGTGAALVAGAGGGPGGMTLLTGIFSVYLVIFFVNVTLGVGLTRLRPWARWTEAVLCILVLTLNVVSMLTALVFGGASRSEELIGLAVGALVVWTILGTVLYLLLSRKGAVVFSPDYHRVIARTPHIKYRTSCLAKSLLLLVVGLLTLVVVGAILSG